MLECMYVLHQTKSWFLGEKENRKRISLSIAYRGVSTLELVGAWQKENCKQSMYETQLVDNNQTVYFLFYKE